MKKHLPLLFVLVATLLASCTQEYTCQCVVKYTGKPPGIPDSALYEYAIRDTKKEAIKKCEANSTKVSQNNVTMDEKCKLY